MGNKDREESREGCMEKGLSGYSTGRETGIYRTEEVGGKGQWGLWGR